MFNKSVLVAALTLIGGSFLSGCAPMISGAMNVIVDDDAVRDKTVKYFGAMPKDVVVYEIEKGALATTYKAKRDGKIYNCNIYYGAVTCKQPGT